MGWCTQWKLNTCSSPCMTTHVLVHQIHTGHPCIGITQWSHQIRSQALCWLYFGTTILCICRLSAQEANSRNADMTCTTGGLTKFESWQFENKLVEGGNKCLSCSSSTCLFPFLFSKLQPLVMRAAVDKTGPNTNDSMQSTMASHWRTRAVSLTLLNLVSRSPGGFV